MTFILACETMEKMGYRAIYCNLGKGDDSEDALAAEAIYAIPGCEGVVFRVVAAEYNITRTLVGVKRASGSTTSVEHVMEVARRIEDSGELDEYFSSYAEASGVAISPVGAVDSYTEGSEAVIMENGCFSLGEAEESYDKIVASATEEQRRRWHIERSAGVVATPIREISEGEVTRRERAANSTGAALRAKRYGEVKG